MSFTTEIICSQVERKHQWKDYWFLFLVFTSIIIMYSDILEKERRNIYEREDDNDLPIDVKSYCVDIQIRYCTSVQYSVRKREEKKTDYITYSENCLSINININKNWRNDLVWYSVWMSPFLITHIFDILIELMRKTLVRLNFPSFGLWVLCYVIYCIFY